MFDGDLSPHDRLMRADEALARLGGIASRGSLRRLISAATLRRAIESGLVVKDARGRYSSGFADQSIHAATALAGTVSHLSAAQYWGWELKSTPAVPHVTVPRNRRVEPARRRRVAVHWADLHADDRIDPGVTTKVRTLTDCLATCPFDESLAVADSALRHGAVTADGLVAATSALRGPGSANARRVARLADGRAANPFESVLRAIVIDIKGLDVVPQWPITAPGFFARPDLVDESSRLVLEADSHTWHSSRQALRRDCRRYNELVLLGWTVLRFTWEDVMHHPDLVRGDLGRFKHAQR